MIISNKRKSWIDHYFNITKEVSSMSTCIRRQIGALAVKDNRILSSGFNGAPPGMEHCTDIGKCLRDALKIKSGERHEICRAIHAEENVIIQAALDGISLLNCDIFVTHQPCSMCIKKLIRLKPVNLYYQHPYPDPLAITYLREYFGSWKTLPGNIINYKLKER